MTMVAEKDNGFILRALSKHQIACLVHPTRSNRIPSSQ